MNRLARFLLSAVAAAGLSMAALAEAPATTQSARPAGVPQGVGFNMHIAGTDQDWDAIKAAGAVLVRHDFAWRGIERVKGEYDFSKYDAILKNMEDRGIRALFILDYANPLYGRPEVTDEGRDAFAKWAAASARHYRGRGILWEIWNEPNVGFWKGQGKSNSAAFAAQYVALVKAVVPAMRAADPKCFIMGGSVSCLWKDSFVWIDEVFKQGLLDTGIDALSVHPYGYPRPELCIDNDQPGTKETESYGLLRQKLTKAGKPNFTVVNTEVGYPLKKNNVTEEQRAMLFVRTCLVDQICNMHFTVWYNWDEVDAAMHKVRNPSGGELPLYKACKNMTVEMAGYQFSERLKIGTEFDYVLAFESAAKARKIIAWTVPRKRDESQDKAIAHEVAIPAGGATLVAVRDLYGKAVDAATADGQVRVTLTASPLYIELGPKSAKP